MDAMADLSKPEDRFGRGEQFQRRSDAACHAALQKRGLPLAVNQVYFSLLHREIERKWRVKDRQGIGGNIIAYTPLEFGLLSGKHHNDPYPTREQTLLPPLDVPATDRAHRSVGRCPAGDWRGDAATPAQVALNWVIHFHGEIIVTIPGATKVDQAQESAGAMKFRLDG